MKDFQLLCHFVMQEKYGNGEPSDEMMNSILADIQNVDYDRVIGVGGGTVIDISKIFALRGVKDVTDAFEHKIPIVKEKSLVIIPTTCGTGSEVTNISIAEIKSKHTKMGLALLPRLQRLMISNSSQPISRKWLATGSCSTQVGEPSAWGVPG